MGKSQAAIQSLLQQSYIYTFFIFSTKLYSVTCQYNQYFPTIVTLTNQMNCKHSEFWSCGLQCMVLMYCMCYATSMSAELNYQQFSGLDRVVGVDTEFLRR